MPSSETVSIVALAQVLYKDVTMQIYSLNNLIVWMIDRRWRDDGGML